MRLLSTFVIILLFSLTGKAQTGTVGNKPDTTTLKPSAQTSSASTQTWISSRTAIAAPKVDVDGKIRATEGAADDAALELNGSIKVSGTNKAAFQINMGTLAGNPNYFATGAANSVDYYRITTPMIANEPNAIILATPVSSVLSFPFWVGYDASNTIGGGAGQWYIAQPRNSSGVGGFTNGMRFNLLIIKQ